jgi:hypothetical protein
MIQQNEVIILFLGVGAMLFILANRRQIARIPSWRILLAGFYLLLAGWLFTVVEGLAWMGLFNFAEHLSYALSSIVLAYWCRRVFAEGRGGQERRGEMR